MLDIVFMGTPAFAVPALEALASDTDGRYRVVRVYTRPDAASGRGKALLPSPVRQAAKRLGIEVETPATLGAPFALPPCDFAVVAAYGKIIPGELLAQPRHGFINIHASLLPRWRGAAPIQRALLAGDEQVGVSIMRIERELDAGAYCAQASCTVGDKDAVALTDELAVAGARLLAQMLPAIAEGSAQWREQDPALVTYAAKVEKDELALDPALSAAEDLRRVRASSPQAPARCRVCGRGVTVLAALAVPVPAAPAPAGAVSCVDKRLFLSTAQGVLEVCALKPDGKQAMSAAAFVAGLRNAEQVWGAL